MKSIPSAACLLALALLLSFIPLPGQADEVTDPAVEAAKIWLNLVDTKKYRESWEEAAPFFKSHVAESDWVKMISAVRSPFGEVKSRELIQAVPTKVLPGAPDGEYVVIQFQTSFQNKAEAVETITPMKDDKGAWRVSGYYVK